MKDLYEGHSKGKNQWPVEKTTNDSLRALLKRNEGSMRGKM